MEYYWGSVRISNPKTLQAWIDKGWYQKQLEDGFIFNTGCGRFRSKVCTCAKCKKSTNSPLQKIINKYNTKTNSNE